MVTPAEVQMDLSLEGDKSVKSHLLQGILDLFLETLNIYNNHLGDLKKISTQLLITLFMAWSLLGVILVELLLFVESVIVFVWRLLVRLVKLMRIKDNTKVLIDETQKRHAKRERQKAQRREQERRRQEEQEEREYLRETERQKELMIVEASLSQEAECEILSTSLALEQASASSQSASEALVEESQATSESEAVSESATSEK
ncbi:hypothetical protein [Streptococcus thermophilus]|uniref:hypothetical protein n=1 Tax=Streptococcus thermophilus TaxID=1308 RepID=UPI001EF8DD60|nr:hypothetical protein [Streptococcus thermophilus]